MQLSDITNNTGLVQAVEFWTRQPYGSSGNTLKEIISRLNRAFDNIMPLLLSYSDHIRWDDLNHTDAPIGYVSIVSGQSDYKITDDDNDLDILNLTRVRILLSASGTERTELARMFINDERALDAMAPNPSVAGVPTHFLEVGNNLYLYPEPNYAATSGIELFFEREQKVFTVTGTSANDTTSPGIPSPFHELLVWYTSQDWLMVNKPDDSITINRLEVKIQKKEQQLFDLISLKNPTPVRLETTTGGSLGSSLTAESGKIKSSYQDSSR